MDAWMERWGWLGGERAQRPLPLLPPLEWLPAPLHCSFCLVHLSVRVCPVPVGPCRGGGAGPGAQGGGEEARRRRG